MRAVQRLYRRRVRPTQVVSPELATTLSQVSHEIGRQVGMLVDRRGHPEHVFVGDAGKLWLPDFGRLRAGKGRLRGLRLVHTHLRGEPLSSDDLTDLALLRLDLVAAVSINGDGQPGQVQCAHLLPEGPQRQMWTVLPPFSVHDTSLDFLELIRSLEDEFARQSGVQLAETIGQERALLVHLHTPRVTRSVEVCVAELRALCDTAGVNVLDVVLQRRDQPDPRYVVGRGKLEELVLRANQLDAQLLVFDPSLSPAQARAVSETTELKVIDRTMLILDIFAQRARSRDGKIQVELAQLNYTLPRLVEKNTMMSRLTGGIGGRGPGETKLEINRRRARERIARLEHQIRELSKRRGQRRALRQRRGLPVVAIVGYTNAGKSTLLNSLTQSTEPVENKLFATLDPKSSRLRFPRDRELILTDTVGFIHDLPPELTNAFRATLEEVAESDLLLHLVDISDDDYLDKIQAVRQIVEDLGLGHTRQVLVLNKLDRLPPDERRRRLRDQEAVSISAVDHDTLGPLLREMERALWHGQRAARNKT